MNVKKLRKSALEARILKGRKFQAKTWHFGTQGVFDFRGLDDLKKRFRQIHSDLAYCTFVFSDELSYFEFRNCEFTFPESERKDFMKFAKLHGFKVTSSKARVKKRGRLEHAYHRVYLRLPL